MAFRGNDINFNDEERMREKYRVVLFVNRFDVEEFERTFKYSCLEINREKTETLVCLKFRLHLEREP